MTAVKIVVDNLVAKEYTGYEGDGDWRPYACNLDLLLPILRKYEGLGAILHINPAVNPCDHDSVGLHYIAHMDGVDIAKQAKAYRYNGTGSAIDHLKAGAEKERLDKEKDL